MFDKNSVKKIILATSFILIVKCVIQLETECIQKQNTINNLDKKFRPREAFICYGMSIIQFRNGHACVKYTTSLYSFTNIDMEQNATKTNIILEDES